MKHSDQETLSAMMDGEWPTRDARRTIVDISGDSVLRACWGRYHLARDAMRVEAFEVRGSIVERVAAALADEPAYTNVTAIGGVPVAEQETGPVSTARAPIDERPALVDEGTAGSSGVDGPSTGTSGTGAHAAEAPAEVPVAVAGTGPTRGARIRTFAMGFGLAASVALVTAVGLNVWQGGPEGAADSRVASADGVAESPRPADDAVVDATRADAFSQQITGAPLPQVELVSNTGSYWSASDSSALRSDSEARLNMFLSRHIEESPTAERQGMLPYSRLVGYDERPEAR